MFTPFIFFILLFIPKNTSETTKEIDFNQRKNEVFKKRLSVYETIWLKDINNRLYSDSEKRMKIMIIFSEKKDKGCTMCFKWEAEWWLQFIKEHKKDSLVDIFLVLSHCDDIARTKRSLEVCQIDLPIILDNESKLLNDFDFDWTPAVLITYDNVVVSHYISDMYNRDLSKEFMGKCLKFITIFSPQSVQ